jgi:hypothetical protein
VPGLNISKDNQRGLAILREMSEDGFQSLFRDIEQSPGSIPTAKNLSPDDAILVMDTIREMYRIRAYAGVPLEEFISDIRESLIEENQLKPDDAPRFRERLVRVLDVEALNVAARGFTLLNEHERVFCSVRIITDARPVYVKDPSGPPEAMVITHILRIDYHVAGGGLDEIYIGLGTNDIKELRNALDRAEKKAKSLQTAFEAAKIRFVDPQQD